MIIRDARQQDLTSIARLSGQAFGLSSWEPGVFHRLLQEAKNRPRHQYILVAESAPNHVVGYLVLQLIVDEAEIQAVAVEESCRRCGVASALLREGLRHCADMGGTTIFLEVRESNQAARNFYRRFGFQDFGRRPDYYRHPSEDAILMRFSLPSATQ